MHKEVQIKHDLICDMIICLEAFRPQDPVTISNTLILTGFSDSNYPPRCVWGQYRHFLYQVDCYHLQFI